MNTEKPPTPAQLALLQRIADQADGCLVVIEVRGAEHNTLTICTQRGWTRWSKAKWCGLGGHYLTKAGMAVLAADK